jgi:hypothetical protein
MVYGLCNLAHSPSSLSTHPSSLTKHIHPIFLAVLAACSTFASDMALLDLDKIIIKRTILGIRCTACGGNLVMAKKRTLLGRLIKWIALGTVTPKNYECENCQKRHLLL